MPIYPKQRFVGSNDADFQAEIATLMGMLAGQATTSIS